MTSLTNAPQAASEPVTGQATPPNSTLGESWVPDAGHGYPRVQMPSGDLLRQLIVAYGRRDDEAFQAAAWTLVREERGKNHRLLADDLERLLRGTRSTSVAASMDVPRDKERGLPLVDITDPAYGWERLVLAPSLIKDLQTVVEENLRRELLAAHGMKPRQRLIFYGPPGTGKTLAAGAVASALGIPLATVRLDALVSSYLGETAANLSKVFEFISRGVWVVLFDEFDSIGKDRDTQDEHGELKRVVNALLQMMDRFNGSSLLIAATNHQYLLDSAVWRRFDGVMAFDLPSRQERTLMLRLFLRGVAGRGLETDRLSDELVGASGADIELIALDASRRAILKGQTVTSAHVRQALLDFKRRARAIASAIHPAPRQAAR